MVLAAMIALLIFAKKINKSKAGMIRAQSVLAALLAVGVLVNGILMGPCGICSPASWPRPGR